MAPEQSRQGQLVSVPDEVVDFGRGPDPATLLDRISLGFHATWRRKWIALAVFLVGVDASVAYYRFKPAVYRVEATILARRRQSPPPARPDAAQGAPTPSAWEMVHQRENLLALIDEANLLSPPVAKPATTDLGDQPRRTASNLQRDFASDSDSIALIRRLDHALEVTTGEGTITVAIEWPDPGQAHRLVNVALKRLLDMRRGQSAETVDEVVRPAEMPRKPVSPDPIRVFGIGTLASLLLAVTVAIAFNRRPHGIARDRQGETRGVLRVREERIGSAADVVLKRGAESANAYQELWFTLARRQWRSLVLVPADEGESVAGVAVRLADVGRRLRHEPVTFFIIADPIDYGSAAKIIAAFEAKRQSSDELATPSTGQVIVAIQPVVTEPLGLSVTASADVAVICAEAGRTRLAAARRTIELIGPERIAGCLVVHGASA